MISPVTSNVPATDVFPVAEATVNLSVAMSKSPSTPVAPVTSNVPEIDVFPVEKLPVMLTQDVYNYNNE